jgi:predicted Rossmann fold flavoprotein
MDNGTDNLDLIVIGGGPAGMMCAGRAAERGARVLLLEKNNGLGKKLLLTGGGRCNLTNAVSPLRNLVSRYGKGGKPLFAAFSRFSNEDAVAFFNGRGLMTRIEAEGRIFPASQDGRDVLRTLVEYMRKGKVRVVLNAEVRSISCHDGGARVMSSAGEFRAHSIAIGTGGYAYPETGSTGEGFVWLAKLGHKLISPDVSLVPIKVKEPWIAELAGLSFPNAKATIYSVGNPSASLGTRKILARTGKLLFTHFGLSGPLILNISKLIGEAFKKGSVEAVIDILSEKNQTEFDAEFLAAFRANQNKKLKNLLSEMIPPKIAGAVLRQCGLDGDKFVNSVPRDERLLLSRAAKALRFSVAGLLSYDEAIVSSGGVDPAEVDFRTMRSKIKPNLYLLGDILNINRPSGGFSLQICWTTGYLAGENVKIYER